MELSEEHKKIILDLFKNGSYHACEFCGNNDWQVNDTFFQVGEFNDGILTGKPLKVIPLLVIFCTECHNTKFINAIKLGLIDQKDPFSKNKKGDLNG
jgi:hypothetical protein